ncbi:TetR/AcrR family transcriptional regulator [Nocardioides lianchengensis]|uniref:DNA-binding transcriptional regulator, AcrR family n=1 Tax=Nocardioides lianchengensis TaxID=1045774 RepID=A0A1G7C5J1_9ACTN|nr:TetR/AcrR family transcriptional regulator [Nocardioides lianchengensis]NYG09359.1 AcrR family transcriptional regulator [Nocardioides lianchengensis]SDE34040.1 DNA-binding transcriptional regulator, AcrR family [Nocardioides lianchengensis]
MSATTRKPGARDRLVAAAERLFYADGIHAVGVDRLCAEAEVSKRSLYQHFAGKDDVIVAMLEARGAALRSMGDPGADAPPRERVLGVFDALERAAQDDGFRGCPFVGAATELKDPAHPASVTARQHKEALTAWFAERAREADVAEPDALALQLTLLFDGASAYAVVRGGSTAATRQAVGILLDAHGA